MIVVLVCAVAALGFVGYQRLGARSPSTVELQVAHVRRGDVVGTVSVSGSIALKRQVSLAFKGAGRVAEVLVQKGDYVKAGDVLARLEAGELKQAVAQAEAGLAAAQAALAKLKAGARPEEVAAAEAGVTSAQANLKAAQADLDSAKARLAQLLAGPDESAIETARLNLEQARNNLWYIQLERDAHQGNPATPGYILDQFKAQIGNAEIAVRQAEIAYEQAQAGPSGEEIAIAKAAVKAAQARVDSAKALVAQAQAQLDLLKAGPSAEDIAAAEAQVAQAQAALNQAKLALEAATLVAPFDGTVAFVGADVGELVSSATPMIILADLSDYHIDLNIDETDIGRIEVGQKVKVTLDAFPDEELMGKVTNIDPLATVTQGVVTYRVTVSLEPTDLPLKPDMTAVADIIVERKEGVLLVPNRAIKRDQEGKYVEVLVGDRLERVYITTGLSDGTVTEVIAGLEEGMEVVISTTRRNVFKEMGGFPFGRR